MMISFVINWFYEKTGPSIVAFHPGEERRIALKNAREIIRSVSTRYIIEYVSNQNFTGREQLDIVDTDITRGENTMIEHFLYMMGYR